VHGQHHGRSRQREQPKEPRGGPSIAKPKSPSHARCSASTTFDTGPHAALFPASNQTTISISALSISTIQHATTYSCQSTTSCPHSAQTLRIKAPPLPTLLGADTDTPLPSQDMLSIHQSTNLRDCDIVPPGSQNRIPVATITITPGTIKHEGTHSLRPLSLQIRIRRHCPLACVAFTPAPPIPTHRDE
jgi:hypothetical protein